MSSLIMETSERESLLRQIAEVEQQLARLQEQKEKAETALRSLRERLAKDADDDPLHPSNTSALPVSATTALTRDDKVALFLRLFRGRDDVYPKLWQNQNTGTKGYSPACANEWVRGVCDKSPG